MSRCFFIAKRRDASKIGNASPGLISKPIIQVHICLWLKYITVSSKNFNI